VLTGMLVGLSSQRVQGMGNKNTIYEELRLSKISKIILKVISTDPDALRFYERFGFINKFVEMEKLIHIE
jgi:hypothetical protein